MANPEHVEMLRQGWDVWHAWRDSLPDVTPDLREADLQELDLSEMDLHGVDLTGAYLFESSLTGTDLRGVNLEFAHLRLARCHAANLEGAFLQGANLMEVDLWGAILRDARLIEADLEYATFDNTDVTGCDFSRATIAATKFVNTDLSTAKGLDLIQHKGPSSVDIYTLFASGGKIPEQFLRSCGLPKTFIARIPDLVNAVESSQFYSCFISYAHADKAFARRLHEALQGRGIRCWLDEHQVLPGHDIYEEVDRGIRLWDKVLLCCSKDSLTSWWVDNEINSAFAKEQLLTKQHKRKVRALIPLNMDGYMFSGQWETGKAEQIRSRLAADFTGWETDNKKFDEEFERLVRALRTDEGREVPPPARL